MYVRHCITAGNVASDIPSSGRSLTCLYLSGRQFFTASLDVAKSQVYYNEVNISLELDYLFPF